jgi:CrcB protein
MISAIAVIMIGAGLGAVLRWILGIWLNPIWPNLPLGTLTANLVGGLIIGLVGEFFVSRGPLPQEWRLAVITGFLGGLTTFSTFSYEVSTLIQQGRIISAGIEITAHLVGSILLTLTGIVIAQHLFR